MASEIRVNKINSSSGVGTITLSPTGVDISGITTVSTLKVGTGLTASEDGDVFFTGVCTATTFTGSGANLTSLPAAQLSGTLPALSAANLTSIPAANVTGTLPAISGANLTSLTAANLTGSLPAISAASCTSIPAANIVGLATAGFERSGGFGGGIEMAETWRLTSNITNDGSENVITANLAKQSNPSGYGKLGSETMTESSGVFTFPSTGIYYITANSMHYALGDSTLANGASILINTTTDNSSYTRASYAAQAVPTTYDYGSGNCHYIFDVTNVSTHKLRFSHSGTSGSIQAGSANDSQTFFLFMKLGDT